jgi:hypothetical protein
MTIFKKKQQQQQSGSSILGEWLKKFTASPLYVSELPWKSI